MGHSRSKDGGTRGGIHAGRDVIMEAGGDIVVRDRITTTSVQSVDVEALERQLDELVAVVRELRRALDEAADVDEDEREEVVHELAGAGKELSAASKELKALPPGQVPSKGLLTSIGEHMQALVTVGQHAATLATGAKSLAIKLGPIVTAVGKTLGLA